MNTDDTNRDCFPRHRVARLASESEAVVRGATRVFDGRRARLLPPGSLVASRATRRRAMLIHDPDESHDEWDGMSNSLTPFPDFITSVFIRVHPCSSVVPRP